MLAERSMAVNALSRVAFVATFVWAVAMGALVPGVLFWLAYGKLLGIVVGLIGGSIAFLIHRFAWSE